MRHKVFGRKLNRDIKERKALFRSLVSSLIINGSIKTTHAKAKAVGSLIEKLVTKAKDGSRQSIIQISSFLNKKEPIKKLTDEIAPIFKDKIGGYLRIIKLGRRAGDNAQEVRMEWSLKQEASLKGKQNAETKKSEIKKESEKSPKPKTEKKEEKKKVKTNTNKKK